MSASHVNVYEKIWIALAAVMIACFLGALSVAAGLHAVHPPSHVETIDPVLVRTDSPYATPEVIYHPDGLTEVIARVEMFRFLPAVIRVPVGRPVRFRMTSPDVIHGFQVVGTNANVMVIPGYVSDFTTTFPNAGEYLILCNEYCGLSHHQMQAKLIVEPTSEGELP